MKMQFDKSGRRFFFLTFAVKGRRKVLSRVVEQAGPNGESGAIAELSPAGGAVVELWRNVHRRWPCLTASHFVVMPDHVHLLLVADYRRNPDFDILGWFHRFRREAAGAVAPVLGVPPEDAWEERYWLMLLNAGRPLGTVRRYIRANPARWLWKERHPDRFARRSCLRHLSLDPGLDWTAVGNVTLLDSPFLFPVRLTRRLSVEEHRSAIERALDRARRGAVPVCGFLSPGEKELERRLREDACARWIKTVPYGLPAGFDPGVEDSRALAAGRLLVLSSFPDGIPAVPVSRGNCLLMNKRNGELCRRAAGAADGNGQQPGPCPEPRGSGRKEPT
ncbi:MAG: hypothetical protein IJS32_05585 [Kiritimatiellae bacterium]|nr:hypothetical protein [Kiritimatiellia bacterium]